MWNLVWKEWKEIIYNKVIWCITIVVSIILIIGTSYIAYISKNTQQTAPVTIGIADYDGSFYSQMLVEYFKKDDNFNRFALLKEGNDAQLKDWLQKGEVDAYLILPVKFAENLIRIEHVPVEVKISTKDSTTAILLKNVMEGYEKYISAVEINAVALYEIMKKDGMSKTRIDEKNKEISIDLVLTAVGRDSFFTYKEDSRIAYTSILNYYQYAILSVLILYLGMLPGMHLLKDKEEKIMDRIIMSCIKKHQYIMAKWFAYSLLFSLMLSLCYIVNSIISGEKINGEVLLFYCLAINVSVILGLFFAYLCKNRRTFLLCGNSLYLLCGILGGTVIPIMYMPEKIYQISKFTPNYWFIKFMLSLI